MIFPIVMLLTHAAWIKFFETCFFVNTSFYVFKCQFLHSSILGTYTLGVRHTPIQTDNDVTFQIVR